MNYFPQKNNHVAISVYTILSESLERPA